MPQWAETKRVYPNQRSIAKVRELLANGPRHEREIIACCTECRAAVKWMRQHGMAERLMDGRVRLLRK